MTRRDFALLAMVCLVWGANLPLTRWLAADVPPLSIAALRFGGTALCLSPLLRRRPPQLALVLAVGLLMGGLQFSLQYAGLSLASASASAIAAQLGLPFTLLLSAVVLKETISPSQVVGLLLGIGGVFIIGYNPVSVSFSPGLLLIVSSAFSVSVGMVLMKRLTGIAGLELQAWAGVASVLPVCVASAFLETGQWRALAAAGVLKWAGIAASILLSSIVAQAIFYRVVRRNQVSVVAPLMLMTPVWAVAIGAFALGEKLSGRALAGSLATLAGVAIIAAGFKAHPTDSQDVGDRFLRGR